MSRRWISTFFALLVLTACGGSPAATTAGSAQEAPGQGLVASAPTTAPAAEPATDAGTTAPSGGATGNAPAGNNAAAFGRMVIRNATLSIQVQKADAAEAQLRTLVQSVGGYVLQSQTSGDEEYRSVQLTFKVPVERFDETVTALEKLGTKVLSRNITGQDVTDEFVDTQSRIRNLEATEKRLLEFLQQAENVEEALQVNQQLSDLQGQIEQAKGRIQFLTQSVAMSTITVDLQPPTVLAFTQDEPWRPGTTASRAWHSLLAFGQGLADVAIALAIWSPVWGVLLLAGLAVRRWLGRRPSSPQPNI